MIEVRYMRDGDMSDWSLGGSTGGVRDFLSSFAELFLEANRTKMAQGKFVPFGKALHARCRCCRAIGSAATLPGARNPASARRTLLALE